MGKLDAYLHAINLESFYRIDDDTLITAPDLRFPAIKFDSPLHEELACRMKDPEQVAIVHRAYQKYIEVKKEITA